MRQRDTISARQQCRADKAPWDFGEITPSAKSARGAEPHTCSATAAAATGFCQDGGEHRTQPQVNSHCAVLCSQRRPGRGRGGGQDSAPPPRRIPERQRPTERGGKGAQLSGASQGPKAAHRAAHAPPRAPAGMRPSSTPAAHTRPSCRPGVHGHVYAAQGSSPTKEAAPSHLPQHSWASEAGLARRRAQHRGERGSPLPTWAPRQLPRVSAHPDATPDFS